MDKDGWLPLTMGEKIVGKARIDLETRKMEAILDGEFAEILNEGLGANLMSISFYGRPASTISIASAQEKFDKYLKE